MKDLGIKEITFYVEVTKSYEYTISEERGCDMPQTHKELIQMVNRISGQPMSELDINTEVATETATELLDYTITTN